MRADDNTKNALKYLEQLTWLLFLKVFDSLEENREMVARIDGTTYTPLIEDHYRWGTWAHDPGLTGDKLIGFVTDDLLPYLRELSGSPRAERFAAIFAEVRTVMKSGYSLKEVIAIVDSIDFHALDNHHAMSVIYEWLLAQTADAGWSGEFYTPRPVVETMVRCIDPKLGEKVYDPCCGSAGFLVASAEHIAPTTKTREQRDQFNSHTIHGQESGEISALAAGAAVAVAVTASAGQPAPTGRSAQNAASGSSPRPAPAASTRLTAWTVAENPDGTLKVTIREMEDPSGLQATLRADGARVVVTASLAWPAACGEWRGGNYRMGDQVVQTENRTGLPSADGAEFLIRPSAIPAGALLWVGLSQTGKPAGVYGPPGPMSFGYLTAGQACARS
jgi:hypothetical protein